MNSRQEKIIELISENKIETQSDLANKLTECGFEATQSTVSRDIRVLGIVKKNDNGTTYYALRQAFEKSDDKYEKIFKASVLSVRLSGNILVIKTIAGGANAACAMLDNYFEHILLGSVAGDDAIISVAESDHSAKKVYNELLSMIK